MKLLAGPLTRRLTSSLAAITVLGALLTIWLPAIPPGQDAPGHITAVNAILHPERYEGLLAVRWAPTAQAFHAVAWAFGHALDVFSAAKATLTLYFGLQLLGFRAIAKYSDGDPDLAVAAAAAAFVGWPFAMGFFNYLAAIAIGSLAVAAWLANRYRWAALMLVLTCWAHVVTGAMFVVQCAAISLFADRKMWWPNSRWIAIALPLGVAAAIAGLAMVAQSNAGADERMVSTYLPATETARNLIALAFVGFGRAGWLLMPLAVLTLVGALSPGTPTTPTQRAGVATSACWTLGFLVLPFHGLGWHYASPRVLPLAHALPLASMPAATLRGLGALLFASVAAATTIESAAVASIEGQRIADVVRSFGAEPVGKAYLVTYAPQAETPNAPYALPLVGVGRYATLNGGADPGLFAFNPIRDSVTFAQPMVELFPRTRDLFTLVSTPCLPSPECDSQNLARADRIAATAAHWDSVILTQPPASLPPRLQERGFRFTAPNVARPNPARVTLSLTVPAEATGAVVFRAGYLSTTGWIRGGRVPLPSLEPSLHLAFEALPAGPIAVQAFVDEDDDGEPSADERVLFQRDGIPVPPGGDVALQASAGF